MYALDSCGSLLPTPQKVVFLISACWRTGAEGRSGAYGQIETKEKTWGLCVPSHLPSPIGGEDLEVISHTAVLVPLWTAKQPPPQELGVLTEQCIICIYISYLP